MHLVRPAARAVERTGFEAVEGIDLLVEPIEIAVRSRRPDLVRYRLGEHAELFFAGAAGILGAQALGRGADAFGDLAHQQQVVLGP